MRVRKVPRAEKTSEKRTQGRIVKALRALGWFVSTTSQAQRAQMTAGIPDVFAAHARWGSFWVECKAPHRRTQKYGGCSVSQLQWHAVARQCGLTVVVAYGVDDILDELRKRGAVQ